MKYLVNALASHEVHVARYYMKRGAYVAAANRAQYALKNYPQAPAQEEALLIMIQAYDVLGMPELRNDAERILRKNFPDSTQLDRKSTRLNSSHGYISYAVFCLKKKKKEMNRITLTSRKNSVVVVQ